MEIVYALGLLILAFFFLLLEVFVPSLGVLTLIAVAAFIGAFYFAFGVGSSFGWSLVGVTAVGIPVLLITAFRVFPRTALGKHMILFRPERQKSPAPRETLAALAGKTGVTTSTLRPSGIARIDGQRLDVITRGEMIDSGVAIRVVEILGNRIVVRAVEDPPPPKPDREYL